jgi:predicted metal-dependent phosphoesterase TrpH
MKLIDLHIHTTASDGTFTPTELVDYAVKKNLAAVAITDHDTMRGIQEALDYIKKSNKPLELIPGMEISAEMEESYFGVHLLAYFPNKTDDELINILKNVEVEIAHSSRDYKDVIKIVSEFGGVTSLAHPKEYGLSMDKLSKVVGKLAEAGMKGVECYYTTHSKSETSKLKEIAAIHNLFYTGGSDFHGAHKPSVDLGCGFGDLEIPYVIVDFFKNK